MATATATTDGMTERQQQVYELAADGLSATEMARRLGVTPNAIHGHLKTLRSRKLLDRNNRPRRPQQERSPNGATAVEPSGDTGRSVIEGDIREFVPSLGKAGEEIDERLTVLDIERQRLLALKEAIGELTPA